MPRGRLGEVYSLIDLQLNAQEHAKEAALRSSVSGDFLIKLGIPNIGTKVKNRRKHILEQFTLLAEQTKRQAFLDLVAAFEADLFDALREATGKTRHVLNQHYPQHYPWYVHRHQLAVTSDDIKSLGGYRHRLGGGKDAAEREAYKALADIIEQRDYLAHGRRWEPPAAPSTVEAAYKILRTELNRIVGSDAPTP